MLKNLGFEESATPSSITGFIYDACMENHDCSWDEGQIETPERLTATYQRCLQYGLLERCKRIPARTANDSELRLQHSEDYIELVASSENAEDDQALEHMSASFDGCYFHKDIYKSARMAVGCAIQLVEHIAQKELRNGVALVRPPGHHAMRSEACGYCFFNNVAIATKHALEKLNFQRILVLDWDVHHGQASQRMFYDDPRVLYLSIHRYEHGKMWPNLRESDYDFIGSGHGQGYNINVPINKIGMGDSEYMAIMQQILAPVVTEFDPELVLISAGYDAAVGDPEGKMRVSPTCFAHITHMLRHFAYGRMAVVLEGGYCVKSLSESFALTLRSLLGDPCPSLDPLPAPDQSVVETIHNVITVLRPFWQCFKLQGRSSHPYIGPQYDEDVTFSTPENRLTAFETRGDYPKQTEDEKKAHSDLIDVLIYKENLEKASNRVCLVYDKKMKEHVCEDRAHPEKPDRIQAIYDRHKQYGLLQRCHVVGPRPATLAEVTLVHDRCILDLLKQCVDCEHKLLQTIENGLDSIYLSRGAYPSAIVAAGSLLNVTERILKGESQSGVAIIRPPGHHAESDRCRGFCLLNNVAIAAKYAQTKFGVERILILDWDVHHGNGIQKMFYEDDSILYVSLHRYDNARFYPGDPIAGASYCGKGRGNGYNVNIAWNGDFRQGWESREGDSEYTAAFQQVVMPISYQFCPDLVLVSAGFDAAWGDPLGGLQVTNVGFAHMTHMLSSLANGRVVIALEGGYKLSAIGESMTACTRVLLGDPFPPFHDFHPPKKSAIKSIKETIRIQKRFWSCLQYDVNLPVYEASEAAAAYVGDEDDLADKLQKLNLDSSTSKELPEEM